MHVGRHTFATTFIRNKGDIYRLQKLLGHANIRQKKEFESKSAPSIAIEKIRMVVKVVTLFGIH